MKKFPGDSSFRMTREEMVELVKSQSVTARNYSMGWRAIFDICHGLKISLPAETSCQGAFCS